MLVFFQFLLLVFGANGARILGVVFTPSYSHQIVFQPLWKELSLRGHQVTTITTHPLRNTSLTNLTEIDLSVFTNGGNERVERILNAAKINLLYQLQVVYDMMFDLLDKEFDYPPVKKLINDENAKFDLVISEYFFLSALGFAERFNCPSIGMVSTVGLNWMLSRVGNPSHSSIFPDLVVPSGSKMTLYERISSFLVSFGFEWYMENIIGEREQKIIQKHFGNHYSSVSHLSRNISLLFVNTDYITYSIQPTVPAIIQIGGGWHKIPSKPLPKELKSVLDQASNGFIYFSLGSNIMSGFVPSKTLQTILQVFSELPYTILWKCDEDVETKPQNVFISKWFPQSDVFAHPNIKLFITQGGLQSADEAIYAHVPMVVLPFCADQPINAKRIVNKGFGLKLDLETMDKAQFKDTILEVINNPKYRTNIKRLAELAQDQPMTGLEKAVWWTEYVIRHKGAKHLRSPLLDIPWYQFLLLDVIGALLVTLSVFVYLLYLMIKLVKSKCFSRLKLKTKIN